MNLGQGPQGMNWHQPEDDDFKEAKDESSQDTEGISFPSCS